MDDGDLVAVVVLGVLEGVFGDTSRSDFSDQLDALNDSVDDFVFNAGVFTFLKDFLVNFGSIFTSKCSHRVLANRHQVNVVVESSVALQASAWSHVGVQVEFLAQSEIQRAMSFSNGRHQWTFQSDLVFVHRVNGSLRDAETTVGVSHGRDICDFPFNGNAGNGEDLLHGS
jgi:hypothetical protein